MIRGIFEPKNLLFDIILFLYNSLFTVLFYIKNLTGIPGKNANSVYNIWRKRSLEITPKQ